MLALFGLAPLLSLLKRSTHVEHRPLGPLTSPGSWCALTLEQLLFVILHPLYDPSGVWLRPEAALLALPLIEHSLVPPARDLIHTRYIYDTTLKVSHESLRKNLREVQKLIEYRHLSLKYNPVILGLDAGGRNLALIYAVLFKLLND